jgi:hypothetical protein
MARSLRLTDPPAERDVVTVRVGDAELAEAVRRVVDLMEATDRWRDG